MFCGGIASPLLPGILFTLAAQAQEAAPDGEAAELPKITAEMLDQAAELAGVGPFTAEQKAMMLEGLNEQGEAYAAIRALKMENSVPPAFVFHPQPAALWSRLWRIRQRGSSWTGTCRQRIGSRPH